MQEVQARDIQPRYRTIREMTETQAENPQTKDRVFIYYYEETVTFSQFNRQVNKLANSLLELGIGRGDIVHVYMNNSPNVMAACFALNKIGAVAGPVNCWWGKEEIRYMLNDSEAKGIIFDSCYEMTVSSLKNDCPHLKIFIEHGDKPKPEHHSFGALLAKGSENLKPVDVNPKDPAYIFYTSGTTGQPKGALLCQEGIMSCIEGLRQFMEKGDEDESKQCMLIFLPLFHVNAMMSLVSIIYRGISSTLRLSFSASEFGEVVQRYKPTFMSAVPTIYNILLQIKDQLNQYDLSSMKYAFCGAAPMPVEVFKNFEKEFGIEILEGYGLTEATVASTLNPRDGVRKIGSIGRAVPGQEVVIMDEEGNLLPPGKENTGEICVRGKNVMLGYWKKPEATQQTVVNGWLHTGDMGYKDEDGYLFIVDRKKDMVIRGGENIYPVEIENVLFQHPAVQDAAVIGVPDDIMGEECKAFVVLKPGEKPTEEEIKSFCSDRIAKFKVPRYVQFISALPKNIIGKTLKKELRKMGQVKKK